MLRVFRVAKAVPRLRAIVDALIASFSAVSWVCILVAVFNYIAGCMFMLLLKRRDPFNFGSIPKSMFTILRFETLDTWDEIFNIGLFGCGVFPGGYPYLHPVKYPTMQCDESIRGGGWGMVLAFMLVIVIGAFIIPTLLIGMVSIAFEEASHRTKIILDDTEKLEIVLPRVKALLPDFFSLSRSH